MKRRFLNTFVDDYVIFDLETTGFDPKSSEIIEIGALKYKNGKLVDQLDVFVCPNEPIPRSITNLTHITNEMVKNGLSIKEAMDQFLKFIEDFVLVAHNAAFDLSFIEENMERLELGVLSNQAIDTVYLARKYIEDVENHKLETLKHYFGLQFGSHRSIDDCLTTNTVYEYCKNKSLIKS